MYNIQTKVKDYPFGFESEWATLEVGMPKNKATNSLFLRSLENHPRLFPLLQQLLGLQLWTAKTSAFFFL